MGTGALRRHHRKHNPVAIATNTTTTAIATATLQQSLNAFGDATTGP